MAEVAPATAAGAGSLWNANSWHWESRNYNKWSEEEVRSRLQSFTATDAASGVTVRVTSLKELKVEATVNIRKGKKIPVFDISFTAGWDAQPSTATAAGGAEPADGPKVSGEVKVIELMPDDIEDEFDVRVSVTEPRGHADLAAKSREFMGKGAGAKALRTLLRQWLRALVEHDGGQEKLALDAARRAEEASKTAAARAEKSEDKERIAAEMAEREATRKAEEKRRAEEAAAATRAKAAAGDADAAAAAAAMKKAAEAAAAAEGTGSVWNKGSYHWEEKPLTPWAKERLSALIKGYSIDVPGGHIKIVAVELTGEASCSIRKGKKLVFFDFKVKANWEGQLVDGDGNVLGSGDGEVAIPELDQDNAGTTADGGDADYELKVTAADDGGAKDKQLAALFTKHGLKDFKRKVATFVTELRARG